MSRRRRAPTERPLPSPRNPSKIRQHPSSSVDSPAHQKPRKLSSAQKWTAASDKALFLAIREYGEGKWEEMKNSPGLSHLTSDEIEARWSNHIKPDPIKGPWTS